MLSALAFLAAEVHNELPVPPIVYGLFSLIVFGMLLAALFGFRQAASKIATKENTVSHETDDDAGGHH